MVKTAIKDIPQDSGELPDEILFTINDSHGIAPDLVINIANDLGWKSLILRTGFNAEMAERHAAMAKAAAKAVTQNQSLSTYQNCLLLFLYTTMMFHSRISRLVS